MSLPGQETIIFRVERAAALFRWIGIAIIGVSLAVGNVDRPWPDIVAAVAVLLAHNLFAYIGLARGRVEWFARNINLAVYLATITCVVYFTGADEGIAFIFYPVFLIGLTAYGASARQIVAVTVMCLLLFCGVLALEFALATLERPWGELAGKLLAIIAGGWAVGVLSDQLQRNATAASRHAEALAASEATLRTVLDTAADLILVFDEGERIIDVNERACAFLHMHRDDILGQRPRAFFFDDGTFASKLAALRAHGEYRGETIIVDADGNEHTVDMLVRGFLRDDRRYFVAMAHDITEKKELEEATRLANANLAQLNSELRQVDQMKREFFNTVSVRMRSPVSAILGYADMLLAGELGELSPEQLKAIQTCRRSAQRLLEMVDEAIDIGAREPTNLAGKTRD